MRPQRPKEKAALAATLLVGAVLLLPGCGGGEREEEAGHDGRVRPIRAFVKSQTPSPACGRGARLRSAKPALVAAVRATTLGSRMTFTSCLHPGALCAPVPLPQAGEGW